jgi:hypothetical protein
MTINWNQNQNQQKSLIIPSKEVSDFHSNSDVDSGRLAQHHTLGTDPNQAASGSDFKAHLTEHELEHANDVEGLVLAGIAGVASASTLNRSGRHITIEFNATCTVGQAGGTGIVQVPAIHLPLGVANKYFECFDTGTGNPRAMYFTTTGFWVPIFAIGAGQGTIGYISYTAKSQ